MVVIEETGDSSDEEDMLAKQLSERIRPIGQQLKDPSDHVRRTAIAAVCQLDPANIAVHAVAIRECLRDADAHVRGSAVEAMGKFEPAMLAKHALSILQTLEDVDGYVRLAALDVLWGPPLKHSSVTDPKTCRNSEAAVPQGL